MTRSIKLVRSEAQTIEFDYYSLFRLRIDAKDAVGMENEIFVYLRKPVNPHTGQAEDLFQFLASPVDMVEYPPQEPAEGASPPFFRLAYVELDFRSTADAEAFWEEITREADILVEALDRFDTLTVSQVYIAGDADNYASDSDSESESESA